MLATVRPRDIAGKTRRRMAAEELADPVAVEAKLKKIQAELKTAVQQHDSRLMQIHGVGPAGAAQALADAGDVARFTARNRFASWTGTAPPDASSGDRVRHRLSRAGNRRMEPRPARRRDRAAAPRHRGPRLLPAQARRRQDPAGSPALPQTQALRRRLPTPGGRRRHRRRDRPGRALLGVSTLPPSPARSEPRRGLDNRRSATTRRSRQDGAPHRTNDLDGDKRRCTLKGDRPRALT